MSKKTITLILLSAIFIGCSKKEKAPDCKANCTGGFESIMIRFLDKDGKPAYPDIYQAVNKRTGESVLSPKAGAPGDGYHVVTDDDMRAKFSEIGDLVSVTGMMSKTGEAKSTDFRITGGECSCHVVKIYGASTLQFDK